MWTVVYIAPNKAMAEMLKTILMQEGFLVMVRAAGIPHMGDAGPHELLVPEEEAEEAHEVLTTVQGS